MQVLDRLKMELSNQEYFTDEQYIQFLVENNLTYTDDYVKADMQKNLLYTVLDVLEAVTNDIDLMTGISTEFNDIGQAYQFLEARIQQVKDKIAAIPDPMAALTMKTAVLNLRTSFCECLLPTTEPEVTTINGTAKANN